MKKAVIVEPEIPENTGFIARLAANFGFDLRIVNPRFNLEECRETANKAQDKLREAEIFDNVEKAVEDIGYIIGTKPGRGQNLSDFKASQKVSIMLGRESSGLSNEELDLCDATVHLDTSNYSSVNLSHAAAIFMHSIASTDEDHENISEGAKEKLKQLSGNKTAEAVIGSNPSPSELNRIIGELK